MTARRFEYIQGNQAKYWEVDRRGSTITTWAGKIGGNATPKTKSFDDYMAAEREFDRLIRDKLRRGFVEVEEASVPEAPMPDREVVLQAIDSDLQLHMPPAFTRYIVWYMVEIGVMDKQEQPPDLQRWLYRATRRMAVEEIPDDDDPRADEFWDLYMELSERDRRQESSQHGIVGAYKLAAATDWIVTPKEAATLAEATISRTPRRHKPSGTQQQWLDDWVSFNQAASSAGGYLVDCIEEAY